jgi:hypothetical protein
VPGVGVFGESQGSREVRPGRLVALNYQFGMAFGMRETPPIVVKVWNPQTALLPSDRDDQVGGEVVGAGLDRSMKLIRMARCPLV